MAPRMVHVKSSPNYNWSIRRFVHFRNLRIWASMTSVVTG
jgi:hypothetical protein